MIRRLAHICLVTDQLAAMREFYCDLLGMTVKFSFTNAAGETFGHYIDCGDSTFIEIFDRELKVKQWGGSPGALEHGSFYNHLCFEITELAAYKKRLEEKGIAVGEVQTGMDNSKQAWLKDPDGNAVELMEYTAQSWQLQRPGR